MAIQFENPNIEKTEDVLNVWSNNGMLNWVREVQRNSEILKNNSFWDEDLLHNSIKVQLFWIVNLILSIIVLASLFLLIFRFIKKIIKKDKYKLHYLKPLSFIIIWLVFIYLIWIFFLYDMYSSAMF